MKLKVNCIYKEWLFKQLKPLQLYKCTNCKTKIIYDKKIKKFIHIITYCPYFPTDIPLAKRKGRISIEAS